MSPGRGLIDPYQRDPPGVGVSSATTLRGLRLEGVFLVFPEVFPLTRHRRVDDLSAPASIPVAESFSMRFPVHLALTLAPSFRLPRPPCTGRGHLPDRGVLRPHAGTLTVTPYQSDSDVQFSVPGEVGNPGERFGRIDSQKTRARYAGTRQGATGHLRSCLHGMRFSGCQIDLNCIHPSDPQHGKDRATERRFCTRMEVGQWGTVD